MFQILIYFLCENWNSPSGVSLLALVLVVCLCVYMISNQSTSKKPHVPKLRKLDVLFT